MAAQLPFDTVSVVAGAIWSPSLLAPSDRVPGWSLRTRQVLVELADNPATGVAPMRMVDLAMDDSYRWGEDTPFMHRLPVESLPNGFRAGFQVESFRIDPPMYLRWAIDHFESSGGTITLEHIDDLAQVSGDLIVNCTGLGARELVGDTSMTPIRGQTVAVANPGITDGISDESDIDQIVYIYPRSTEMVLGGTRDPHDDRPDPDPEITARILADTAALDHRLAGLEVITERVGFRPGRTEVRLEADQLDDGRPVIHNSGHGGAGYIMSWGCADEVVGLVNAHL